MQEVLRIGMVRMANGSTLTVRSTETPNPQPVLLRGHRRPARAGIRESVVQALKTQAYISIPTPTNHGLQLVPATLELLLLPGHSSIFRIARCFLECPCALDERKQKVLAKYNILVNILLVLRLLTHATQRCPHFCDSPLVAHIRHDRYPPFFCAQDGQLFQQVRFAARILTRLSSFARTDLRLFTSKPPNQVF